MGFVSMTVPSAEPIRQHGCVDPAARQVTCAEALATERGEKNWRRAKERMVSCSSGERMLRMCGE